MNQVALLSDFDESNLKTIRHSNQTLLLIKEGNTVHAVDNRCPHMGFPLSKGTVKDGILTCHWHHARFDAQSGCAFDLFADDIPSYDVKVEGGGVFISDTPRRKPTASYFRERLEQGLEQNISITLYKSIIGLLQSETSHLEIAKQIAEFGSRNHETWSDGMTTLAMTVNLWSDLKESTRLRALCKAAKQVASNCENRPARRERHALEGGSFEEAQLLGWFSQWTMTRHRDGAERTMLTALEGKETISLSKMLTGALHNRVYSSTGHDFDFVNKAIELDSALAGEISKDLYPLIIPVIVNARGEEEKSGWRSPIDLIPIIQEAEGRLENAWSESIQYPDTDLSQLRKFLQGEDPQAIIDHILTLVESKADPKRIAKEIAYVAALRLAQFPESNDVADWFAPVHTLNFANAVYQSISRNPNLESARGLLPAALSVFQDRYLNIPQVNLPNPSEELIASYQENSDWHHKLLDTLNEKRSWKLFPERIVAAHRAGKSLSELIDALASAALREDFDFHKLQSVEAAAVQAKVWKGTVEVEGILAGAARHLAAHAPTPRGQSNMIDIARRLQRGEKLYEEAS